MKNINNFRGHYYAIGVGKSTARGEVEKVTYKEIEKRYLQQTNWWTFNNNDFWL